MNRLRAAVDTLETHVSADLWPLPTYRELLFLK
jgi:glutamine synthetase type III